MRKFLAMALLMVLAAQLASADFSLKWTRNIGNNRGYQILPVMGDIDDDGVQEIVTAVGSNIISVNARTGALEWNRTGSSATAVELVDVDNDGTPEVLYGTSGYQIRALRGDGSTLWTSPRLPGNIFALYPIVAADIDGDGFPEIYAANGDITPTPYSGNMSDYTGAITMLDHNGRILRSTWIHHPCWGGLSLADSDRDGRFELYAGDRRNGYLNFPALGPQAFDAHTLEPIWSRPEIQHSSPIPVLADITGDADLETLLSWCCYRGLIVADSATGENIFDYSTAGLPTHATPTVFDIDDDGNMEAILGTSYPSYAAPLFVVFDLITGQVDFTYNLSAHTTHPPKVGNVAGGSLPEIVVAEGDQSSTTGNYRVLAFDSEFDLVDSITLQNFGQLSHPVIGDADGDGLNEVIVSGFAAKLAVIETDGQTPSPAPRTGVQLYSEYRRGVAEYVPPPGVAEAQAPVLEDESPEDGSTVSGNPTLSIYASDPQDDEMDILFERRSGSNWLLLQQYDNAGSGTYTAQLGTSLADDYEWRVRADDGDGHVTIESFHLTIESASPWPLPDWDHRKKLTIDGDRVYGDLSSFPVLVKLDDADLAEKAQSDGDDIVFALQDGTLLSHEIERYAEGALEAWVRVPHLSSSEDTIMYMYYGNADSGSQENPAAVWDTGYLAVHHLSETSGTIEDSTERNNDGTPLNGLLQDATGRIDGADRLDGSDDRITLPRLFTTQTAFTVEGWVNTASKHGYIFSQRNTAGSGAFVQYYPREGNFQVYSNDRIARVTAGTDAWHHVVATLDSGTLRLYVDGNAPAVVTGASIAWPNLQSLYGDRATLGRAFQGTLDEMRVSGIARSEAYIRTSHANQNEPHLFYSVGAEE